MTEINLKPDKKALVDAACDAAISARGVAAVCDASAKLGGISPLGTRRVRLALSVVAEYGVRLPEMAAEIRERVVTAVEAQAGCTVTAVDITVADLYIPGEPMTVRGMGTDLMSGARLDF